MPSGSASFCFPKSARLRKRSDFTSLAGSPNKYAVKGFLVVWSPNDRNGPRVGITVSRKIGCAVVRNRIKRLARETFRCTCLQLPCVDLNIIARRESALMDLHRVMQELEKAFRHIRTCSNP